MVQQLSDILCDIPRPITAVQRQSNDTKEMYGYF